MFVFGELVTPYNMCHNMRLHMFYFATIYRIVYIICYNTYCKLQHLIVAICTILLLHIATIKWLSSVTCCITQNSCCMLLQYATTYIAGRSEWGSSTECCKLHINCLMSLPYAVSLLLFATLRDRNFLLMSQIATMYDIYRAGGKALGLYIYVGKFIMICNMCYNM